MDPRTEVETLREKLERHNHMYYILAQPEITDAEYDQLFRRLVDLEAKHPELRDECSPTQRIGAASTTGFAKVRHERRMLSLDNAFTAEEVLAALHGESVLFMEPKIDGLSLKLVYKDGRLVQAITRGDGMQGDDVTANARTIRTIPLRLQGDPRDIEVTGEVYMSKDVFEALNVQAVADGDEPFANARNAAAGTLKLKDPAEVAARALSFVAHGTPTETEGLLTQQALCAFFQELGFQTVYTIPVTEECESVAKLVIAKDASHLRYEIAAADSRRQHLVVETDGLVFKIDSLSKQRELGEGTRAPNWAAAFKFPPERQTTKLVAVTLQVGRTGKITPVAELEPVRLSGTVVRRASLCNQDEIVRLGIGIGDSVYVSKSAEIIPKVVGLASSRSSGPFQLPATCPCCQQPLAKFEGIVDVYCVNPQCADQVYARLVYATGKSALDIDGCGDVLVRLLMDAGNVRSLADLFALTDLSFIKPAARQRFSEGREKAKFAPFWRKLNALNIEGWGRSTSQDVAAHWSSLNEVLEAAVPDKQAPVSALQRVVGKLKFEHFVAYLSAHCDELERLEGLGFKFETLAEAKGRLTGKVFVITGALMSGTRDHVMRRIEKAGGTVKSSVSAKVHYLIVGSDAGGTKTKAAAKLGVTVIEETELYEMMGEPMPVLSETNLEEF